MSKDYLYDKNPSPKFNRRKVIFGGKDSDSIIKGFFGCTATITIFILGLITIFLVKEGSGFLGQYQESQKYYRLSGLEYVDILKELREDHTALTRYLNSIKSNWIKDLRNLGKTQKEVSELVFSKDARSFFNGYSRTSREVKKYIKSKMDLAIETKDLQITNDNINDSLLLYTKRISEIEAID